MLTYSEIELLRKTIKEKINEELVYIRGMYILDPSVSNLHFCEKVDLLFEKEKWCPEFLECFRKDLAEPFEYSCPVGITHYFVPLRCFNKHIINICIESRRIRNEPNLEWLQKKTGEKLFKGMPDKKHFYCIPPLDGDKGIIEDKQQRVLKILKQAAAKRVGSSEFLKDIFCDIATKLSNLNDLLTAIRDKSVEISNADRGCLFLNEKGKFKHIVPCKEFINGKPCSLHRHKKCFEMVIEKQIPVLLPSDYYDFQTGEADRSSLTVPLTIDQKGIGLIHVSSRNESNFTNIHAERLQDLATYASTAIGNAKSFEEKSIEVKKLETLYKVDTLMQDYLNEEHALMLFLLGVTFADGLRFNRAIFLEYDNRLNILRGKIAVGPVNKREAKKRLSEEMVMSRLSLDWCITEYKLKGLPDKELNWMIKKIEIPVRADSDDVFSKCVVKRKIQKVYNLNLNLDFISKLDLDSIYVVVVPIVYKRGETEDVLGVLIVDNLYCDVISEGSCEIPKGDLQLLEVFVQRAAVTLKNIKSAIEEGRNLSETKDQLRHALRDRETISRIGNMIAKNLNLEDVLSHIINGSLSLVGSNRGSIMLYDNLKKTIRVKKGMNLPSKKEYIIKLNSDTFSQAIKTKHPVIINDLLKEQKKMISTDEGIRSRLIVPLKIEDTVIGVLSVDDRNPQKYSQNDQRKLQILADYAAIAIQNARLYQKTDKALAKKVEELQTLYALGTKITSQVKLRTVLDSIIEQALKILAEDLNLGIFLFDPNANELVLESSHGTIAAPPFPSMFTIPVEGVEGKSLIADAFRQKNLIYTKNVVKTPLYLRIIQNTRSELDIPLRYKGDVIGVLNAESEKMAHGDKLWVNAHGWN